MVSKEKGNGRRANSDFDPGKLFRFAGRFAICGFFMPGAVMWIFPLMSSRGENPFAGAMITLLWPTAGYFAIAFLDGGDRWDSGLAVVFFILSLLNSAYIFALGLFAYYLRWLVLRRE